MSDRLGDRQITRGLRDLAVNSSGLDSEGSRLMLRAADRIEGLRARVANLRKLRDELYARMQRAHEEGDWT